MCRRISQAWALTAPHVALHVSLLPGIQSVGHTAPLAQPARQSVLVLICVSRVKRLPIEHTEPELVGAGAG